MIQEFTYQLTGFRSRVIITQRNIHHFTEYCVVTVCYKNLKRAGLPIPDGSHTVPTGSKTESTKSGRFRSEDARIIIL